MTSLMKMKTIRSSLLDNVALPLPMLLEKHGLDYMKSKKTVLSKLLSKQVFCSLLMVLKIIKSESMVYLILLLAILQLRTPKTLSLFHP